MKQISCCSLRTQLNIFVAGVFLFLTADGWTQNENPNSEQDQTQKTQLKNLAPNWDNPANESSKTSKDKNDSAAKEMRFNPVLNQPQVPPPGDNPNLAPTREANDLLQRQNEMRYRQNLSQPPIPIPPFGQ